jgi:hypothetical protein
MDNDATGGAVSERAERRRLLRETQDLLTRIRAGREAIMRAGPDELIDVLRRQNRVLHEEGLIDAEQLAAAQRALEGLDELEVRERVNRAVQEAAKDEARLVQLRDVLLDKLNEEEDT